MLDIETIEDDDNMDVRAMKSLLKYKIQRIEELEKQVHSLEVALDREKLKYHEKLDKERTAFNRSIGFLKEQVARKDRRMDVLLDAVMEKDAKINELMSLILEANKE